VFDPGESGESAISPCCSESSLPSQHPYEFQFPGAQDLFYFFIFIHAWRGTPKTLLTQTSLIKYSNQYPKTEPRVAKKYKTKLTNRNLVKRKLQNPNPTKN